MAGFGAAICVLALLLVTVAGTEFRVGGNSGWSEPTGSEKESFNQWAERLRFHKGDTLLFKYTAKQDSVLVVTSEAFQSCNVTGPVAAYDDGNTAFKFSKPGPYYFISGASGHCEKGQKLVVVVMSQGAARRPAVSPAGAPAVASSPAATSDEGPATSPFGNAPAVAPTSRAQAVATVASSVLVSIAVVAAAFLF